MAKCLSKIGRWEHRPDMGIESCRICGGDGRVSNAFGGSSTSCPGCNGSGHRSDSGTVFRDVTKTKPSHHTRPNKAAAAAKSNVPSTFSGTQLAQEIQASALPDDAKAKLVAEIVEYEGSHGKCTETFSKKIRKQLKAH